MCLLGGLCCVCRLAPIQKGCRLETVSQHFYGLVCHCPHFWGYQCCYHGNIQIHDPVSVKLGSKFVSASGTTTHIPVPRRMLTVLLKTDKGYKVWEPWEESVIYTIIAFVLNMTCLKISYVK